MKLQLWLSKHVQTERCHSNVISDYGYSRNNGYFISNSGSSSKEPSK